MSVIQIKQFIHNPLITVRIFDINTKTGPAGTRNTVFISQEMQLERD